MPSYTEKTSGGLLPVKDNKVLVTYEGGSAKPVLSMLGGGARRADLEKGVEAETAAEAALREGTEESMGCIDFSGFLNPMGEVTFRATSREAAPWQTRRFTFRGKPLSNSYTLYVVDGSHIDDNIHETFGFVRAILVDIQTIQKTVTSILRGLGVHAAEHCRSLSEDASEVVYVERCGKSDKCSCGAVAAFHKPGAPRDGRCAVHRRDTDVEESMRVAPVLREQDRRVLLESLANMRELWDSFQHLAPEISERLQRYGCLRKLALGVTVHSCCLEVHKLEWIEASTLMKQCNPASRLGEFLAGGWDADFLKQAAASATDPASGLASKRPLRVISQDSLRHAPPAA